MKSARPSIAPLLRSDLQGSVLATLFLHPQDEFSLTDLAERVGAPVSSVHAEVARLIPGEYLSERRIGRNRMVRANPDHPLTEPLTELLAATYGPLAVLPDLLAEVEGIRQAYVYGSWAERLTGVAGPPPQDLDVLVIGDPSRAALARLQQAASQALAVEVNVSRLAAAEWEDPTLAFTRTVRAGALVPVHGGDPEPEVLP